MPNQTNFDVNDQDRRKNTPLADAEGAKRHGRIELLKSYGGLSYGQNGSHLEPRPVPPPLPNKCDWEIDLGELDFSSSTIIGKVTSVFCFKKTTCVFELVNNESQIFMVYKLSPTKGS